MALTIVSSDIHLTVEQNRISSLLGYLARIANASMLVGQHTPRKIIDALVARNYIQSVVCTLTSFGLEGVKNGRHITLNGIINHIKI